MKHIKRCTGTLSIRKSDLHPCFTSVASESWFHDMGSKVVRHIHKPNAHNVEASSRNHYKLKPHRKSRVEALVGRKTVAHVEVVVVEGRSQR
eukprot:523939-Amphidinium_carterae.1